MRKPKMTRDQLHDYVKRAIEAAYLYEHDDLTSENRRAIEYFFGEMNDVPSDDGRSRAISKDVADVIGGLMPQIMRVFTSSDHIWLYEPSTPQDGAAAKQATEYVNHLFRVRCDGDSVLYDAVHDGLLLRNGIIKAWWDDTPDFDVAEYHGLPEAVAMQLVQGDDVEVLEASEAEPEVVEQEDPMTGQIARIPEPRVDLRLKTKIRDGKLCCEAVPPEDFLIERGCKGIHDARFMTHRNRRSRSDLLEQGFDPELVDNIPEYASFYDEEEEAARHQDRAYDLARTDILDASAEYVEVFESYVRLDMDGDGVSEWVRVITAGTGGGSVLLDFHEWDDDVPFEPIVPDPVPHRWLGRSIFDQVSDIQQQKTVVMRQFLDNLYLHNNPTPIVNRQSVRDQAAADAITTRDGTAAEVDGDPRAAVMYDMVPFIGDKAMVALEYLDSVREMRTGLSKVAAGMDTDVLQNQSATAVMTATSASHARIELYARNIARGVERLGRKIYRIISQNQNRPDVIRLRGEFVEVDPRGWASQMDVTVNTGLGTGSRDRDAAALSTMGAWGQNMMQTFGPTPVFSLRQARALGEKMAETLGIRNYEEFVGGSDEEIQQFEQAQAQAAQTSPEAEKAQMEAQIKQAELQQKGQLEQAQMQMKGQIEAAQMQQRAELDREKMATEAQSRRAEIERDAMLQRERLAAEMASKREQMMAELALKREIATQELALKREFNQMQAANAAAQVHVGGEPG